MGAFLAACHSLAVALPLQARRLLTGPLAGPMCHPGGMRGLTVTGPGVICHIDRSVVSLHVQLRLALRPAFRLAHCLGSTGIATEPVRTA
jgi:hypothetical protein